MIQVFAGRIPSGRALAVKVEPPISVEVSPPDGASIPCAEQPDAAPEPDHTHTVTAKGASSITSMSSSPA